jgi:hypothetical protein
MTWAWRYSFPGSGGLPGLARRGLTRSHFPCSSPLDSWCLASRGNPAQGFTNKPSPVLPHGSSNSGHVTFGSMQVWSTGQGLSQCLCPSQMLNSSLVIWQQASSVGVGRQTRKWSRVGRRGEKILTVSIFLLWKEIFFWHIKWKNLNTAAHTKSQFS